MMMAVMPPALRLCRRHRRHHHRHRGHAAEKPAHAHRSSFRLPYAPKLCRAACRQDE